MTKYTYNEILKQAKNVKANVKKEYKIGMSHKWSYYFAKALLTNKDVEKIKINDAPNPSHTHISRQMTKNQYISLAKTFVKFVEEKHRLPNYLAWKGYKIASNLYTYTFARCLVFYEQYGYYDHEITVNQKVFTKPKESGNKVYDYFVKVFGKVSSIDEALSKIQGRGYGYYYDDKYSNTTAIDRMKSKKGVNCTDSCQVMFNVLLVLIKKGKYKKVECLHIKCRGGDGHVRLRITLNDGTKIYRDPASVLDGGSISSNWCSNGTLISVNPSWFMSNLNR